MSVLSNVDWNAVNTAARVLAKGIYTMSLGDIREEGPTEIPADKLKDGEPPLLEEQVVVPFMLEQAGKLTTGDAVGAGFPVTSRLRFYSTKASGNGEPTPALPEKRAQATRMSQERLKNLMLAASGLKRNDKTDVAKAIVDGGGWPSLKNHKLTVELDVRTAGGVDYQEFVGFSVYIPPPA